MLKHVLGSILDFEEKMEHLMISPLLTPSIPVPLDLLMATLEGIPLRNLWLKAFSKGVVQTKHWEYAVVVRYDWNGILLFVPNTDFRREIASDYRLRILLNAWRDDGRFIFKNPYSVQIPPKSNANEILQRLVPLARAKWELDWLIQEFEEKHQKAETLLMAISTSCFTPQIPVYESKLDRITTAMSQAKQLLTEYEHYIDPRLAFT